MAEYRRLLAPAGVLAFTAGALLLVFHAAERRTETTALPRFCDDPGHHVALVREILVEKEPAGDGSRRPYIIAAKLIYLVPRSADEPLDSYLLRLEKEIREVCP